MRTNFVKAVTAASALLWLAPLAAMAELPKRDLTVELRQIREGQEGQEGPAVGSSYSAGTTARAADFAPQQVRVRNGEKASLRINQSMPMQWVQKIESQSATLSAAGTTASNSSGGVTQAVTWMESGQSLSVTPHWPGGKQAATIEIDVQSSAVDERTSSDLPATTRQHFTTTVSAPLGQWVTMATSGSAAKAGSYSSAGSTDAPRLIQIRVIAN